MWGGGDRLTDAHEAGTYRNSCFAVLVGDVGKSSSLRDQGAEEERKKSRGRRISSETRFTSHTPSASPACPLPRPPPQQRGRGVLLCQRCKNYIFSRNVLVRMSRF